MSGSLVTLLKSVGLGVGLVSDNRVRITGLDALAVAERAHVLDLAKHHKHQLLAELRGEDSPNPWSLPLEGLTGNRRVLAPHPGGGHEDQMNCVVNDYGNHDHRRPCRENCSPRGCCAWVSNGHSDWLVTWRCLGSPVYDGADPNAIELPRLRDMSQCPHGVLPRETGLDDWPPFPPEDVDFGAYESAGSLLDLCRRHGLRVEVSDGKARIVYPPGAPAALVEYAELLLAEGRSHILNMKNQAAEGPEVAQ